MAESKSKPDPKAKPAFKAPRKPTPERLANIALHHLERFASSAENLRRVLERRAAKAARHHPDLDMTQVRGWIDALIERYVRSGLLDDRAYGEGRARALLARGASPRMIRLKLREKGVAADDIDTALAALEDEHADPEWAAAVRLAKRRRLGPFGDPAKRAERRDRDLAALARAGFSYDLAKRVIEAEDAEALEETPEAPGA